ncbi:Aminomethyltransferase folate-binding domain-containing protein [Mycena sanguinolenta]|uniref:Aminomethyltransferase folate-binding domain-containing protein n=1 Tax=Mycena sanguinolenta TaxID=230812 RepID=A0A8H7D0T5_9AGAR|nr:Aminomethyltransferase folate-binding domain-containing protein [Mycena sanguinolenta]
MPPPLRPLIPKIPTIARVPHRSVLSLTGSQASEFLNGILSAQVHSPPRPFYSAFLHAQGRVLYDVFVYTHMNPSTGQPGYLIDYDLRPSEAPPLLDLIQRYKLRSKNKDAEVKKHWKWAENSGVVEPEWDKAGEWPWGSQNEVLRDRRAPGMGNRMLVRNGDRPPEASSHEMAFPEAYTLHRILHGVPEGHTDMPAMQAFPMDSNLDFMGGLDFRKGCYVGQELTVRTYHKGVIRKRILPVVIHPPNSPPSETIVPSPDMPTRPSHGRGENGKLLSSSNGLGLALLRLEQVEAAEEGKLTFSMDVEGEDGTSWGVSHWRPKWWPQRE